MMRYPQPPKKLRVLVDNQEKTNALSFPEWLSWRGGRERTAPRHLFQIEKKIVHLKAGDYTLEGYEHIIVGEKKSRLSELQRNFQSDDRQRQQRAFKKLVSACRHPFLILHFGVSECDGDQYVRNPEYLMDELWREVAFWKLPVLWLPASRSAWVEKRIGAQILRYMWAQVWLTICQGARAPTLPAANAEDIWGSPPKQPKGE